MLFRPRYFEIKSKVERKKQRQIEKGRKSASVHKREREARGEKNDTGSE